MGDRTGAGYIYLIQCEDGWFKIGRTANFEHRMRQNRWQYGRGKALVLLCLAFVGNQYSGEKLLHRIFSHRRAQGHNGLGAGPELFKLSPADVIAFTIWIEIIATDVIYPALFLTDDDWLEQLREVVDGRIPTDPCQDLGR